MTNDTANPATFRVVAPLIQIQGHVPFSGNHQPFNRHLTEGDIVPEWVPADEIKRLHDGGFLEKVKADS